MLTADNLVFVFLRKLTSRSLHGTKLKSKHIVYSIIARQARLLLFVALSASTLRAVQHFAAVAAGDRVRHREVASNLHWLLPRVPRRLRRWVPLLLAAGQPPPQHGCVALLLLAGNYNFATRLQRTRGTVWTRS